MTHHGSSPTSFPEADASTSEQSGRQAELSRDDAEGSAAALPFSGELLRKGLHLVALVIPAGMFVLGKAWSLALLLPGALLAIGADLLRARSPGFARFIRGAFGRMLRPGEVSTVGSRPVLNGATCVLISAVLLALLFPLDLAAPSFAAFMVADAAAAVAGIRFGRLRWAGTARTVEGSAAFVVVALLCLLPFDHISFWAAATAALAGAAAEVPDWPINDNIRVPIVMTAILVLWGL